MTCNHSYDMFYNMWSKQWECYTCWRLVATPWDWSSTDPTESLRTGIEEARRNKGMLLTDTDLHEGQGTQ